MNEVNYTVSFSKPFTHYCEVKIVLKEINQDSVVFSMPVWAPGSYLIREFAKNVENVSAENSSGKKLNFEKISKNSWRVNTKNQKTAEFSYSVYCNELTVRTSEINSDHAFLSSPGVFMYAEGFEKKKCVLTVNLPSGWKKISTGLDKVSKNIFSAENYDEFIDSPVEAGNQNIIEFEIKGIKHFICLSGRGNYTEETLIKDFKIIALEEIKLLGGDIPYRSYTYIIHLVEKGGGGLEHLNSFVVQIQRWAFTDKKIYNKFLGLVSHEFFHLWNVKRIRPEAFGPFDYTKENYSKELWVAEGWTSFYDNLILRRSGLISDNDYYEFIDVEINDIMRFEGRFHQSLEESGYDTWIKFYRKDENYSNTQVSYYTKGALAAMMLNLEIIESTDAEKSLDDALRLLYNDYKKDKSKRFSGQRVKEICESVCGKKLDKFWKKYVSGTDELPLNEYLGYAGLKITNVNENNNESLFSDTETKTEDGKIIITKVHRGSSAFESGLNSGDEIIAADGVRMNPELFKKFFKDKKENQKIKIIISRKGLIEEKEVKILKAIPKYKTEVIPEVTERQKKILNKWLTGSK